MSVNPGTVANYRRIVPHPNPQPPTSSAPLKEVERKWLICEEDLPFNLLKDKIHINIRQGYLAEGDNCVVRVRATDSLGYLTIKSNMGEENPNQCTEIEKSISKQEANTLLAMCPSQIVKTRFYIMEMGIKQGDSIMDAEFTLDSYQDNPCMDSVYIIEAEIKSPDKNSAEDIKNIPLPPWLSRHGVEVTGELSNYDIAKGDVDVSSYFR